MGLAVCETSESHMENVSYIGTVYYRERVPVVNLQYAPEQPNLQKPYTQQECVSIPYIEEECTQEGIAYSITDKTCYRTGWQQNWSNVECTLKNTDSIGGNFTVYTGFGTDLDKYPWIRSGTWVHFTQTGQATTVYLYPGSSKTFEYHLEIKAPDTPFICYCYVASQSTKEVCRNVQKTRQKCHEAVRPTTLSDGGSANDATVDPRAISYKNELKSKSVVKYRAETRYEFIEESC
ncbi:hypothetical protein H0N98_02900 [Candidatus Micrarchaeota archaeon]|nr:hypothetical protein [Candidatus Micrarchaeota archaeon]